MNSIWAREVDDYVIINIVIVIIIFIICLILCRYVIDMCRFRYLLQVRLNLQVNSFPNQVNLFQPRSICFCLGQFVSTSVNLFQT